LFFAYLALKVRDFVGEFEVLVFLGLELSVFGHES